MQIAESETEKEEGQFLVKFDLSTRNGPCGNLIQWLVGQAELFYARPQPRIPALLCGLGRVVIN